MTNPWWEPRDNRVELDQSRAALHEAAHAVAFARAGFPFNSVWVATDWNMGDRPSPAGGIIHWFGDDFEKWEDIQQRIPMEELLWSLGICFLAGESATMLCGLHNPIWSAEDINAFRRWGNPTVSIFDGLCKGHVQSFYSLHSRPPTENERQPWHRAVLDEARRRGGKWVQGNIDAIWYTASALVASPVTAFDLPTKPTTQVVGHRLMRSDIGVVLQKFDVRSKDRAGT